MAVIPAKPIPIDNLVSQLRRDEGLRCQAYCDPLGKWTIGVGHELYGVAPEVACKMRWTEWQSYNQLQADIKQATELVSQFHWYSNLDPIRQAVIQNMAFQLENKLLEFHDLIACCERKDYNGAATAMLDSAWAKQVPKRAQRLATQMRSGTWQ